MRRILTYFGMLTLLASSTSVSLADGEYIYRYKPTLVRVSGSVGNDCDEANANDCSEEDNQDSPPSVYDDEPGTADSAFEFVPAEKGRIGNMYYQCFSASGGYGNYEYIARPAPEQSMPDWVEKFDVKPFALLESNSFPELSPWGDTYPKESEYKGGTSYQYYTTGANKICVRFDETPEYTAGKDPFHIMVKAMDHKTSNPVVSWLDGEAWDALKSYTFTVSRHTRPGGEDGEYINLELTDSNFRDGYSYQCFKANGGAGHYNYQLTTVPGDGLDWVKFADLRTPSTLPASGKGEDKYPADRVNGPSTLSPADEVCVRVVENQYTQDDNYLRTRLRVFDYASATPSWSDKPNGYATENVTFSRMYSEAHDPRNPDPYPDTDDPFWSGYVPSLAGGSPRTQIVDGNWGFDLSGAYGINGVGLHSRTVGGERFSYQCYKANGPDPRWRFWVTTWEIEGNYDWLEKLDIVFRDDLFTKPLTPFDRAFHDGRILRSNETNEFCARFATRKPAPSERKFVNLELIITNGDYDDNKGSTIIFTDLLTPQ